MEIEEKQVRDKVMELAEGDKFAAALGIKCVDAGLGWAVVQMTVGETHLNFLGGCHGGALFALADQAFGLASNSHNTIAVGIDTHMAYLNGAVTGDTLTATAKEISCGNRTAVYRIEVVGQNEKQLAEFTGTVYRTGKPIDK
ncbi:MAG: hotdog fold thioesterase [Rhodospirillaceae bacterium]|nr:hotdog fold thioesterase [Rhodospirillaceae bacterium]MBT5245165.1 hotdog fold thioesterase [Rhodospirillaceae bacterium]MBT6241991.1 hotdog fold thioesterase [Rhodospirillaceae bacterium]